MTNVQEWLTAERQKLNCDFLGIAQDLKSDQTVEIGWVAVSGNLNDHYKHIRLRVGHGIAGLVWKTGRMQIDQAMLADPKKMLEYPIARLERLVSALAVPVLDGNKVQAVLLLGYRQSHDFSLEEKASSLISAEHLASLLEDE